MQRVFHRYLEVVLVRVQAGILVAQGAAIAMMMKGMKAIQHQRGKKRRLNVPRVRCKRRMQVAGKKLIQVAATYKYGQRPGVYPGQPAGAMMSTARDKPASVDLKGGWRCNLWD